MGPPHEGSTHRTMSGKEMVIGKFSANRVQEVPNVSFKQGRRSYLTVYDVYSYG